MRIVTVTLALLILCVLCHAASPESDYIAAVVNGDVITCSQVRVQSAEEIAHLREMLKGEALLGAIKKVRASALNRLIDRQVYIQEFRRVGASLLAGWTDEQIKAASRGRFDRDHQQWLDRLKEKAYIKSFGTLVEDCQDQTATSNHALQLTADRSVTTL